MTDRRTSVLTDIVRTTMRAASPLSYQVSIPGWSAGAEYYSTSTLQPMPTFTHPGLSLVAGYQNAATKVTEFASWTSGWDGEDAKQISREAVARTQSALQTLSWQLPVPEVTPNSNGTLSLEWETPFGIANLEIGRTRYAGYVSSAGYPTQYFEEANQDVSVTVGAVLSALLFGARRPSKPITTIEARNVG